MSWKLVVVLILMLFLVIFAVQNYEVVKIQFLFWAFQTSRAIIIFVTLLLGVIIGWIGGYHYRDNI
ncbi:lipopolysaccharide assembly protein LapA domain-containing protein [Candidatus Omnitrophota bacterium]